MNFFISATGTEIGKTFITCKLIEAYNIKGKTVTALKPVISGYNPSQKDNDTDLLQVAINSGQLNQKVSLEDLALYCFKAPLAASMAADLENQKIDYQKLVQFCNNKLNQADVTLIEGAGGIMAPITHSKTNLDLCQDLNIPLILVTGTYLGAISHTLTSVKAIEQVGVEISHIIVNESQNGVDMELTIAELRNFLNYNLVQVCRENSSHQVSLD